MSIRRIGGSLLAVLGLGAPAWAQDAPIAATGPTRVSANLGLGVGSEDLGGLASFSVGGTWGDVVVRVAETSEFVILTGPPRSAGDVAALYGRRSIGSKGWFRGAAGLGYVRTVDRGDEEECYWFACRHERIESSTVGVALQGDAVWAIAKWLGLGAALVGNVNPDNSFATLTLGIHLGSLR
jgi:hypothetical protein